MERDGSDHGHPAKDHRSDSDGNANGSVSSTAHSRSKGKDNSSTKTSSSAAGNDSHKSPRKRRKVNHGRPCSHETLAEHYSLAILAQHRDLVTRS
jgi:hypothetical protein